MRSIDKRRLIFIHTKRLHIFFYSYTNTHANRMRHVINKFDLIRIYATRFVEFYSLLNFV